MITSPWFVPSLCGLLVVILLYRIWSKNRATTRQKTGVPQTKDSPRPTAAAASSAAKAATVPPPVPAPVTHAGAVAPAAAQPGLPAPYIAASSSTILRGSATPTWEDRRLLEHRGVLSRGETNPMPRMLAADVPGIDDSDRKFGSLLNPALASLLPESPERREQSRKELLAAGYYTPHALENLAATRYVYMMVALIVFGALLLIVPASLEPTIIGGLILGPMLGWALPMLRVRGQSEARKREIEKAMPDLLDMLNMCVTQGLTVPDALKRILRDFRGVYPALSQELSIVTEQAQIINLHTALENFGQRIDLPEVHSFTSLLVQTERMGTSISEALTTYSDTMRESLRQRADEKGNRATFRLLFPTVLCLMPAVYLFLLGPAVIAMADFFNSGGTDSLDSGSTAIRRLNNQRTAPANRRQ